MIILEYTEEVKCNIDEIYSYISQDSYVIAQKFITRLLDYTHMLSIFPELGTLVLKQHNIRKLVYRNYLIIYQINYDSNLIHIIKILNSKQDIQIMLKHIEKYI